MTSSYNAKQESMRDGSNPSTSIWMQNRETNEKEARTRLWSLLGNLTQMGLVARGRLLMQCEVSAPAGLIR